MRYRRITAAILDILIVIFLIAFIFNIIPPNEKLVNTYNEIFKIEASAEKYSDLKEEDLNKINELSFEAEHELVKYYLVISLMLIIYFIFIPYKLKEQTIGQRIRKVRLVSDENITINTFTIRAILNSGLILTIFFPLFVYILNAEWYSIVASFLYLLQFTYWFVSFLMLLIKKETIHDKITHTKIIEVKR